MAEMKMDIDRRKKPRMYQALPVNVRGSEPFGNPYSFDTVARDIGPGGLCAFSPRMMEKGEEISLRIRFARPGSKPLQAPEIMTAAAVLRVEARPGGACIFAVSFLAGGAITD